VTIRACFDCSIIAKSGFSSLLQFLVSVLVLSFLLFHNIVTTARIAVMAMATAIP
jgi:hypothetical protein